MTKRLIIIAAMLLLLSSCGTVAPKPENSPEATGKITATPYEKATPRPSGEGISEEMIPEYKEKYNADEAVKDILLKERVLFIGEESFAGILVIGGIVTETVIPKESVANIEKEEIEAAGMVIVEITDKSGSKITVTLSPEDAEKVK